MTIKTRSPRILYALCLVAACAAILYIMRGSTTQRELVRVLGPSDEQHSRLDPTPTAMPLSLITIPQLRKRNYVSKLDELQNVEMFANYNSYLTSYNSEGLRINALLTKPAEQVPAGGWPAIVFVHGYIPPKQYDTQSKYVDYVDSLAKNGFVVFKIDLRGHGQSEGEARGAYYSADYVIDTLSARSALQFSGFVNPDKIGLWGHSMAGNVVLRSAAVEPQIPAISIWAGAVLSYEDWGKYGIQDNSFVPFPTPTGPTTTPSLRAQVAQLYGEPDISQPFWSRMSPASYIHELQGAIQFNHAIDDDVVDIGYSRDFAQLLEQKGIDYELNEYPTGGHNIAGSSFVRAMENTVRFFQTHLK